MRNGIHPWLSLCVILVLVSGLARADGLSAELDRTRIGADETLSLHLVADGDLKGEPDLGALEKDFEVLGQSTGTSMSIVNGTVSHTREWTLELSPRRTGRLTVPPLSLGGFQSRPIQVEVGTGSQTASAGAGKPVFVDTRVDTKNPYVQQGFIYRVRVLYREQPRRATLRNPEADGATLEQAGEDKSYAEMVDGRRYTVIERTYRVVPQRSGPLTIRGPRLEAVLPAERQGPRRSPFADFEDSFGAPIFQGFPNLADLGAGRRVIERGPDRTVEVRPQPDGTGATWLPAESVALTDEWTPSPPRFRVGEPITRTLVITAQGATAAQLPTLDPGAPDGVKVYPEPPKTEDLAGSTAPTALKTLKVALVPTRDGPLTLPEIRLPWWDTVADRARVAVIPQRTVQVEPGADGAGTVERQAHAATGFAAQTAGGTRAQPASGAGEGSLSPVGFDGGVTPAQGPLAWLADAGPWPWLALVLGLGWVTTLVWHWRVRRGGRGGPAPDGKRPDRSAESLSTARASVRGACQRSDARATRTALLAWGRARWRGDAPGGLAELAARLGRDPAEAILAEIDRANYAAAAEPWDGPSAWTVLEPLLVAAERETADRSHDPLPELYPRLG
jgi:hypothetical protein